jgi:hypothetical protein
LQPQLQFFAAELVKTTILQPTRPIFKLFSAALTKKCSFTLQPDVEVYHH